MGFRGEIGCLKWNVVARSLFRATWRSRCYFEMIVATETGLPRHSLRFDPRKDDQVRCRMNDGWMRTVIHTFIQSSISLLIRVNPPSEDLV